MDYNKLLLPIGAAWVVLCVVIGIIGSKHKKKPNPKFDKVPIIIGISVPVLIGILAVIGAIFFK